MANMGWIAWVAATNYPGQATGTGAVTITDGHLIILNVTPAFPIGSLVIQEGIDDTQLIHFQWLYPECNR